MQNTDYRKLKLDYAIVIWRWDLFMRIFVYTSQFLKENSWGTHASRK